MTLLAALPFALAAEYGPLEEEDVLPNSGQIPDAAETGDTGAPVGCADSWLQDGVQLPDMPQFFNRMTPNAAWGTQEMVDLIVETAQHMRWLMPDSSRIAVGDISQRRGGFLSGHKSHRGGVDADIGIFRVGRSQPSNRFDTLRSHEFDVEANWAMISAMLETGKVDFILLDRGHITRLKAYTVQNGLLTPEEADRIFPPEGSRRVWQDTGILHHAPNHADHVHVRVLCADGSKAR